jgi:hypothetical protein
MTPFILKEVNMEAWRKIRVKRYIQAFPKDAEAIAEMLLGEKVRKLEEKVRELKENASKTKKPKGKKNDNG